MQLMAKKRIDPKIERYETENASEQLECWARWVDARSLCRKMEKEGVETIDIQEFLINKHYTLTIEEFKRIIKHYKK